MNKLEPQLFDLAVTSPPYDNLRDYQGYTFDFPSIAAQLWRVTKKGGVVVWVVGDQTIDGSETGTSFRQALGFMELGFRLHDTMIYEKPIAPFPQLNRYTGLFEFMFVLSKGKPGVTNIIRIPCIPQANGKIRKRKGGYRQVDGSFKIAQGQTGHSTKKKGNIWRYIVGGNFANDNLASGHPAVFPEALARDHIISWSNPGDLVLDPMMGSGTTLKAAQQLGRRAVGIEISEGYCKIAVERLRQRSLWQVSTLDKPMPQPKQDEMELTGAASASDLTDRLAQCPDCGGTGAQVVNTGLMPEHGNLEQWSCDRCGGDGEVELNHNYTALAINAASATPPPC